MELDAHINLSMWTKSKREDRSMWGKSKNGTTYKHVHVHKGIVWASAAEESKKKKGKTII
jgi:hypothetical protein